MLELGCEPYYMQIECLNATIFPKCITRIYVLAVLLCTGDASVANRLGISTGLR